MTATSSGSRRPRSRSLFRRRRRPHSDRGEATRVRRTPFDRRHRAWRFLAVLAVLVVIAFALTVTRVSPIAYGSPQVRALRLLPMMGFVVLLAGVIVASVGVTAFGQRDLARSVLGFGLVGTLLVALAVSNVMRDPILRAVGGRAGRQLADRTAAEQGQYQRVPFIEDMLGNISLFTLPRDEPVLRAAFYSAYLGAFEGPYYTMVDRDAQREAGHEEGFAAGKQAGRKAGLRDEELQEDPRDAALTTSLRVSDLPEFLEGFEEGYEDGWRAGYAAVTR